MASGRRRIRAGIALLILGGVIATAACASFRWRAFGTISWKTSWLSANLGEGELSLHLNIGPDEDEGSWGWNVGGSELHSSGFRWTIWRDAAGKSMRSSLGGYCGLVTPIAALERYSGSISMTCGNLSVSEQNLIARLERTRVVRLTVASAFAPVVPLAIGGLIFRSGWRAKRRAEVGACAACGYDMVGIAMRCPECGMEGTGRSHHDDHDGDDREKDVDRD